MADYKKLKPFILKWEGGYSNRKHDRGGPTNRGVILATFRQFYGKSKGINDLKAMTDAQWDYIFLNGFWNPFHATEITSQGIANICVDWAWASGTVTAIRQVQKALRVAVDGKVGKITLAALNGTNKKAVFETIKARRLQFVENIVKNDPVQAENLKGWKNRINAIKFE